MYNFIKRNLHPIVAYPVLLAVYGVLFASVLCFILLCLSLTVTPEVVKASVYASLALAAMMLGKP